MTSLKFTVCVKSCVIVDDKTVVQRIFIGHKGTRPTLHQHLLPLPCNPHLPRKCIREEVIYLSLPLPLSLPRMDYAVSSKTKFMVTLRIVFRFFCKHISTTRICELRLFISPFISARRVHK